jgi:hypothetical protein
MSVLFKSMFYNARLLAARAPKKQLLSQLLRKLILFTLPTLVYCTVGVLSEPILHFELNGSEPV